MAYSDTYNYGSHIHTNQFLSNFLMGYKLANPVADFVAPTFLVKRPSDKYGIYNKTINIVYNTETRPNQEPAEIGYEVDQAVYRCKMHRLSKGVTYWDRENTDEPFNLDYDAVRFLKRALAIAREKRVAAIAASASFVTQTMSSRPWSTYGSGTPVEDILSAMSTILTATGGYQANKIVIPSAVALAMVKTTAWKDYFKWSASGFDQGLFSVADGLKNLGLQPMMTAVQGTTSMSVTGSDPSQETIWGTNVLVFYSEENPSLETRTFMFSPYTVRDLIKTIPEPKLDRDLHIIKEEIDELPVDMSCGYLIQTT